MYSDYYILSWFVFGIFLIILEFGAISGIGFLFIGLGSMTLATLLYSYPVLEHYQLSALGIISLFWFLLLWWPLKKFAYNKHSGKYSDVLGSEVIVFESKIKPGKMGKVLWSGTIMNAKLKSDDTRTAEIGDKLYVIDVKGNILTVTFASR